jgi:hypothetical protein
MKRGVGGIRKKADSTDLCDRVPWHVLNRYNRRYTIATNAATRNIVVSPYFSTICNGRYWT